MAYESHRIGEARLRYRPRSPNISPGERATDCISIGEVNHEKLFPRVPAIIHHGGAGTAVTAARGGRSKVVVPHNYDRYY